MKREQVLDEFRAAGAWLEGHFLLSSGLHSPAYFQCARVMMDARRGARLCRALAEKLRARLSQPITRIVSPALGGILVGYEMGRQLKAPAVFLERVQGRFTLRRGFAIEKGDNCLVVEDIITTGGSAREVIAAVKEQGGRVVGAACLIDRSGGKAKLGTRIVSLARVHVPAYDADNLPPQLQAIPPLRAGSRGLE